MLKNDSGRRLLACRTKLQVSGDARGGAALELIAGEHEHRSPLLQVVVPPAFLARFPGAARALKVALGTDVAGERWPSSGCTCCLCSRRAVSHSSSLSESLIARAVELAS